MLYRTGFKNKTSYLFIKMKDNSVKTLFYRFYNTVNMYYSLMTLIRDK